MFSIIFDPEVRTFSVSTKMFGSGNKNKNKNKNIQIVDEDWKKLSPQEQDEFKRLPNDKKKEWANNHNVKLKDNNNNNGGGGGKDKDNKDKDATGNHWTKNSPKIYAYEKLLKKNLEELKRENRVIEYKKIEDNWIVETPGDIYIQIYVNAEGDYIVSKIDMQYGGNYGNARRFNAMVVGPKDLRNVISNARKLEEPGFIRSLILRGVGRLTGVDLVDKVNFKLW